MPASPATPVRTLAVAALAAATMVCLAAVPPGPAVVGGDAGAGVLRILPAVSRVEAAAGGGTTVALRLENGADRSVTFRLDASEVVTGSDGSLTLADGSDGPSSWVTFADAEVTLDAATVGDIRPAVNVPDGSTLPATVALVARAGADEPPLVAYLAIDRVGGEADLSLSVDTARKGRRVTTATSITNGGTASSIATLRTSARAWYGSRVVDVTSGPLLVVAGQTRTITTTFEAPAVPGTYTTEVVAATGDHVARATTSSLLWNPAAPVMLAAVLLVAGTSVALVRVRRRATDDDPQPG